MTCACCALLPATEWSHGTINRPPFIWMPMPGPVAYHVQSDFFTSLVISIGLDHVTPSSVLFVTQTVRDPRLVPLTIIASVSLPRLWVRSNQMVPVCVS